MGRLIAEELWRSRRWSLSITVVLRNPRDVRRTNGRTVKESEACGASQWRSLGTSGNSETGQQLPRGWTRADEPLTVPRDPSGALARRWSRRAWTGIAHLPQDSSESRGDSAMNDRALASSPRRCPDVLLLEVHVWTGSSLRQSSDGQDESLVQRVLPGGSWMQTDDSPKILRDLGWLVNSLMALQ